MTVEPRIIVSSDAVRALAVARQGLAMRPNTAGKDEMLATIQRIGLLQLDSVNVVARSHYLVMLSRLGLYEVADLDALLYPDRKLFEQWAHAACLLPVEDHPFLLPDILSRRRQPLSPWRSAALGPEPEALLNWVLEEVRDRGSVTSRDFEDTRGQGEPWWGFKPAKHALIVQYMRGHLMVDRRVNFQIYYDLAERVLPNHNKLPPKSQRAYRKWAVLRGLACLGVATASHVADYYRLNIRTARSVLKELVSSGEVLQVGVPDWGEVAYLDAELLPELHMIERDGNSAEVTTFLSPFDNLIWDRKRVKMLFGFDYTIEIYVPAAKRVYGYYVMPILHRGRLVGRIDPKADRQAGVLRVRHLYLEPGQQADDPLVSSLAQALREFMAFHELEGIEIEHADPVALQKSLRGQLEDVWVE